MESAFASHVRDDEVVQRAVSQLAGAGFCALSGPFSSESLKVLVRTYDEAMAAASGPNFNVGSTTTRMADLLSFDAIFDEVFLYVPLVSIGSRFFKQDFILSSFLGRTLRPNTPAQALHTDLPRSSNDAPLLGFILMIDSFRTDNGATRFVPGSHKWPDIPAESMVDPRSTYPGEHLSCGPAGTMVLFNAATWHGHTANLTPAPRRSIQGYFIRRGVRQGLNFRNVLSYDVQNRMSPLARNLLAID